MTVPSSLVVMVPSPSLSNREKASLNSAICSEARRGADKERGHGKFLCTKKHEPARRRGSPRAHFREGAGGRGGGEQGSACMYAVRTFGEDVGLWSARGETEGQGEVHTVHKVSSSEATATKEGGRKAEGQSMRGLRLWRHRLQDIWPGRAGRMRGGGCGAHHIDLNWR